MYLMQYKTKPIDRHYVTPLTSKVVLDEIKKQIFTACCIEIKKN